MNAVVNDYYNDESSRRENNGDINLWRLYNHFTGVNKFTFIDQFIDRSVNAYNFVEMLKWSLEDIDTNWYLN